MEERQPVETPSARQTSRESLEHSEAAQLHERGAPAAWRLSPEEHGYPDPLVELIAARFRVLGEPLRLKLLAAISSGERSVGDLVTLTGANQPNVSKHLAALAQAGLVSRRKAGTTIYYTLADQSVLTLCDAVCSSVQQRFASQACALGMAVMDAKDER